MKMPTIAPSLLAADKTRLREETVLARDAGCPYVHFDVMDGKFVPAVSFSLDDFSKIKGIENLVYDVHIMVEEPWVLGEAYAKAGADIVTFHIEACHNREEVERTVRAIRDNGAKVGLSIKPHTPASAYLEVLDLPISLFLIMSVEPGKGGQAFIEGSLEKLKETKKIIGERDILLEVDGGIDGVTGPKCVEAGADILVAGSYLYGHDDFIDRVKGLQNVDL